MSKEETQQTQVKNEVEDTLTQQLAALNLEKEKPEEKEIEKDKEKEKQKKEQEEKEKEKEKEKAAKEWKLKELTLQSIAEGIKNGHFKNIIVMVGAGISVAAGIPDFRTPGTGLYANLQKYNLPSPESVFEINFFRKNPKPFFTLAKELYPDNFKPTKAHYFIHLLHKKGVLLRCFSQNIDTLERVAGLPADKIIEAHGNFAESHCIDCRQSVPNDEVKKAIFNSEILKCVKCNGLVKPDIVFFGENLPQRFFKLLKEDFPKCDLLIVMGTSLLVHPFAMLVDLPKEGVPKLLLNRELAGPFRRDDNPVSRKASSPTLNEGNIKPMISHLGDVQESVTDLVRSIGWEEDLFTLMNSPVSSPFSSASTDSK